MHQAKESKKQDKKDVKREKGKGALAEPAEPKSQVQDQQPRTHSPSPATNRNSIKINLAELLPPEAKDEEEEAKEEDSGPIYDMFGDNPEPEPVRKGFNAKKLEIPKSSLQLISSLYDEEDEEDMVPTNSLCIGSNQIKPRKVKKKEEERNKDSESGIANPPPLPSPVVVKAEPKVDVKPEPETAPVVAVKQELPPSPKPSPPPLLIPGRQQPMGEMKALDLLKTLESESTEVDDFLQQIQQQRQLIEEKLSGAASARKPPPPATKFLIDIDSVQREINDKLEELPEIDDYAELPTIPLNLDFKKTSFPISKSPLQKMPDSSSSSSSDDSSNSSSSDEVDSDSDTSGSSSDTSSSSQSSVSSSNASSRGEAEKNLESTPVKLNLAVDLTLASRSPVMLKIQPKPRVIPVLTALGDEEVQHTSATVAKRTSPSSSTARRKSTSDPKERKDRQEKSKRRESRRDDKTERPKNRGFSYERRSSPSRKHSSRESTSGPRERSQRERAPKERSSRKAEREPKKDKDRRRPKSIERISRRRSRSKSLSPPPTRPSRPLDRRMESRSRSRSLSVDREEHGRKRSPWRPPIDFWENLNVPTNSWAYNDEQYFSRAYYDESYNYFEQNQINQHCGGGGDGYRDGNGAHQSWQPPQNREMTNGGSSSPMRDSLDDRINHVLNGGIQQQPPPQHHLQENPYPCYDNNSGYNEYSRPAHNSHPPNYYNQPQQQHQYDNRGPGGGDHYRQSANLLSINCSDAPRQAPPAPFALQKGNVIELVPSQLDSNLSSSGYHSEEQQHNEGARTRTTSSTHRKHIREKKRMEKNMRKKKLELELQQLLEGSSGIEINIEGERLVIALSVRPVFTVSD